MVERVIAAESPTLITTYERQIKQLEEQRILIEEKIQKCGTVDDRLVKINRTSWEFLGNPHDYWISSPIERKRLVLKATFARPLAYHRNEGYRTPALSLPFLVLKEFSNQKEVMVETRGVEPLTSCMPCKRSTN
jgi:site-specific DNA recombinase